MALEILVIDDDKVTSSMLKKLLSDRGFKVHTAFDGESGLQMAKELKPAAVICDMLLPKIHGADICQKIKTTPELKHIKVIMITAIYKEVLFRAEARQWGADLFLEKPINSQELLSWLEKNLARQEPPARPKAGKIKIETVDVDEVLANLKDMLDK